MKKSIVCLALATLGAGQAADVHAQATPDQIVSALENKFGVYPGERRNHTKGICFSGEFKATPEAAELSRSPLFQGEPVTVVGRFSQAGGNLHIADNTPNAHGMALRFTLPDGQLHQMAMLDIPFFDVATPEGFLQKQLATTPDPATGKPDPAKVQAFKNAFPETRRLGQALAGQSRIPAGYHRLTYNSIHTFMLENTEGQATPVRWSFVPAEDQPAYLSVEQAASLDDNYLLQALETGLKDSDIRWHMNITLANDGDPLTDPSQPWNGTHKVIEAGTLQLQAVHTDADAACRSINFDPLRLSDGVKASDDPVLQARSPAYAISFGKRSQEASQKE
ncbi:catalase family peroxidase [Oceanimonas sp. CHS3-5]|uniref:catalase family peroxidase n=1 Tax=Oceanimonas sp. CHS3-5 TaxID=3068186 RepID=UPI00273F2C75|nr:catalase family peroxidase [Oceanimonas sp. CHS3-5]MDP5293311.1 catalase family peroxidase [Oceanimonas sp. CHS3-5]